MKDFDLLKVLGTGGKWIWFQVTTGPRPCNLPSTYSHNQLKATQLSSFFTCSNFKILIFFNPVWNDSTQIDILTWF